MLFGFQNVSWQTVLRFKKKKYISDSILDFRRMCRQYFGLQKDVQTVFWTSEGCADSILDFRRMCRQYFGLQKDVQTVFWTSEGYADSVLDFKRICRQYFGLWLHCGPQTYLGMGFLASEKSYIDSIIMDLTLCHRVAKSCCFVCSVFMSASVFSCFCLCVSVCD